MSEDSGILKPKLPGGPPSAFMGLLKFSLFFFLLSRQPPLPSVLCQRSNLLYMLILYLAFSLLGWGRCTGRQMNRDWQNAGIVK